VAIVVSTEAVTMEVALEVLLKASSQVGVPVDEDWLVCFSWRQEVVTDLAFWCFCQLDPEY